MSSAIGIVVNRKKKTALETLHKLKAWLSERKVPHFDTLETPCSEFISKISLLVCLGGDGTLLSASAQLKGKGIPILGVNLGSLGFLTEIKESEMFDELNSFFQGKSQMEKRTLIDCEVSNSSGESRIFSALNDIVISREGLTRILRLEIDISGEKLIRFAGDGVIIATPTGSTAYSLSAGGAIVHPKVDGFLITPICPHSLTLRSVIFHPDEVIEVRMQTERGIDKALITSDGQENLEIDDSFTVKVKRSRHQVTLIKSSTRTYVMNLRENFKFPM